MIKDRNISYKYQSMWIPAAAFDLIGASVDPIDSSETIGELGSSGIVGIDLGAGAGDEAAYFSMPTPTYVDWDNSVFYRVIYAADNTTSTSFAISADETSFGTAPSKVIGTAFVTLTDTPINDVVSATPWGKADSSTSNGIAGTSDFLRINIACTANTVGNPHLIGLEIKHLPKLTDGPQVSDQADPTDA